MFKIVFYAVFRICRCQRADRNPYEAMILSGWYRKKQPSLHQKKKKEGGSKWLRFSSFSRIQCHSKAFILLGRGRGGTARFLENHAERGGVYATNITESRTSIQYFKASLCNLGPL